MFGDPGLRSLLLNRNADGSSDCQPMTKMLPHVPSANCLYGTNRMQEMGVLFIILSISRGYLELYSELYLHMTLQNYKIYMIYANFL